MPVEVSLWTRVTVSKPPSSSLDLTAWGSMGWPHSTWIFSADFPHRWETSNHLSEKAPQQRFRTLERTRLRMVPSMTPHAEEVDR